MNSSCSIQVNVDFVQLMMIVGALSTFVLGYHLCHDFDQVINVVVNHVCLLMHCPGSSYRAVHGAHLHHRPLVQLVIRLVVIHVYYLTVGMIHQMLLLAAVIFVNVDVRD